MSTPRAQQLSSTIDRVLSAHSEHSGVELAAKLGVDKGYVSRLRGGWRPERVRNDLWIRLAALDPGIPGAVSEFARSPYGADADRARLLAMAENARQIMHLVVDLQTQIGAALRATAPTPLSPDELADRALEAVDAVKAAERGARGRRRAQG